MTTLHSCVRRGPAIRRPGPGPWVAALLIAGAALGVVPVAHPQEPGAQPPVDADAGSQAIPWTEKETRLANQYLRLLQQKPEDGAVLDLLWDLYESHGAVELLVDHLGSQAGTNPVAALLHGHLLRRTGRLEDARAAYQRVLDAAPGNVTALGASIELALQAGETDEAVAALERVIEALPAEGPERARRLLELADVHVQRDDAEAAAAAWTRAVEAAPGDVAVRRQAAAGLARVGRFAEAAGHLEPLVDSPDVETRVTVLHELARLYEFDGRFELAVDTLRRGLALSHFRHHEHEEFFRRLVRLHERENRLDEFEAGLVEAAAAPPGGGAPPEQALVDLERFYAQTVRTSDRLDALRALHRAYPDHPEYHHQLAEALVDNDSLEEAAETLDVLLAAGGSESAPLVLLRAEIDAKRGRREEAEARLRGALERFRDRPSVRRDILDFAREQFLDGIAVELLAEEARQRPGDRDAAFALARFHFARGDAEAGGAALEQWIDSGRPGDPKRGQRLREAAELLVALGRLDEAGEMAGAAIVAGGADPAAFLQMAEVHFERGETEEAVSNLEMAWQLSPEDGDARERIDQRILSYFQHRHLEARGGTPEAVVPLHAGIFSPAGESERRWTLVSARFYVIAREGDRFLLKDVVDLHETAVTLDELPDNSPARARLEAITRPEPAVVGDNRTWTIGGTSQTGHVVGRDDASITLGLTTGRKTRVAIAALDDEARRHLESFPESMVPPDEIDLPIGRSFDARLSQVQADRDRTVVLTRTDATGGTRVEHRPLAQFSPADAAHLRTRSPQGPSVPAAASRSSPGTSPGDDAPRYSSETLRFAGALAATAEEDPTPANLRRAAWWAFRTDNLGGAYHWIRELSRTVGIADADTAAFVLEIAQASRNYGLSKRMLERLADLDPANATAHRVRLAELESSPSPDGPDLPMRAIEILEAVIREQPDHPGALEALARAYEHAGKLELALGVWQRAFDRAPDDVVRANLLGPLTAAFLARGQLEDALDAYTRLVVSERDATRRRELFGRQLALASSTAAEGARRTRAIQARIRLSKNPSPASPSGTLFGPQGIQSEDAEEALSILRDDYTALQADHPFDPFFSEALAQIHRAAGKQEEAFAAMKRAYYTAPEPNAAQLVELRELARELGDDESAVYFQRQLILTTDRRAAADEWRTLVEMLEQQLDLTAADQARERLERRFSEDVDLLEELLRQYRDTDRPAAALRVAERLHRLRPWEPATAFQLAVAYREQRQLREAFDSFCAVIDHIPADRHAGAPLCALSDAATLEGAVNASNFLQTAEEHRLEAHLERLAGAAQAVPTDEGGLRLRSVEEAARIAAELGGETAEAWHRRWQAVAAEQPAAAFRAHFHAGDRPAATDLLALSMAESSREPEAFACALAALRLRSVDLLRDWVTSPTESAFARAKRKRFLGAAAEALVRLNDDAVDPAALAALRDVGLLDERDLWTLSSAAVDALHHRQAVAIGELARDARGRLGAARAYTLASWARAAGDTASRHRFLSEALDAADSRTGRIALSAFSQLYRMSRDPAERERLVERISRFRLPDSALGALITPDELIDLVIRRGTAPDGAASAREAVLPPRDVPVPDGSAAPTERLYWRNLFSTSQVLEEHHLDTLADRIGESALSSIASWPTENAETAEQLRTLLGQRLLARFDHQSFPERRREVERLFAMPFTREELTDLAFDLEENGFAREALLVFAELLAREPGNVDYYHALRRTSERSLDFDFALEYYRSVLVTGDRPPPKDVRAEPLAAEFARMLRLAGDLESLEQFAAAAPGSDAAPAAPTRRELPFLAELAGLLTDLGRHEEAIGPLRTLAEADPRSHEAARALARALEEVGRPGDALGVLEGVALDGRVPAEEALGIMKARISLGALAGATATPAEDLLASARRIFAANPGRLAAPFGEIAREAAEAAGLRREAAGTVELAMRAVADPPVRTELAVTLLAILSADGPPESRDADAIQRTLGSAMRGTRPDATLVDRLAETLADHRERILDAWRAWIADGGHLHVSVNPALVTLASLSLREPPPEGFEPARAARSDGATGPVVEAIVASLLEAGKPADALAAWEAAEQRGGLILTRPLHVRIHAALGDEPSLGEIVADALDETSSATLFGTRLPVAFAEIGRPDLADALFARQWDAARPFARRTSFFGDRFAELVRAYAAFLADQGRPAEAENLVVRSVDLVPGDGASILVDLHRRLFPVDGRSLDARLQRCHLGSGVLHQVDLLGRATDDAPAVPGPVGR